MVATLLSNSEAAAAVLAKTKVSSTTMGVNVNQSSSKVNDRGQASSYSNGRNINKNGVVSGASGQGNVNYQNNYQNRSNSMNPVNSAGNAGKAGYSNFNGQNHMNYNVGVNGGPHTQFNHNAGNNNFAYGRGVLSSNMNQLHHMHNSQQMQQMLLPPPPTGAGGPGTNMPVASPPSMSVLPGSNAMSYNNGRMKGNAHYSQIQQQQMLQRNNLTNVPKGVVNTNQQVNYRQTGINNKTSNYAYSGNFPGSQPQSGLLLQQRNQQGNIPNSNNIPVTTLPLANPHYKGSVGASTLPVNSSSSKDTVNTNLHSMLPGNLPGNRNQHLLRPAVGMVGTQLPSRGTGANSKPGMVQSNSITNYFTSGTSTGAGTGTGTVDVRDKVVVAPNVKK